METTAAQGLYASQEHAAYDAACKRLLAEKYLLAWIMKHCVQEYQEIGIDDIVEKYIEGAPQVSDTPVLPDETNAPRITGIGGEDVTITEGTVRYDIRFHAIAPRSGELIRLIINVEAQNDFYPGYSLIRRAIYYCSRMISAQHGTEFTHSHYEQIKKVYSIWICYNPPKERQNTITQYAFAETPLVGRVQESRTEYDLMTAVMVCLGDPAGAERDGLLRLLEVVFSEERTPEEKCNILQRDFNIPVNEQIEGEVSDVCNLSKGVERRGIEKGIGIGVERGIGIGDERRRLDDLKAMMLKLRLSAAEAMDILNVPQADRERYAALLAQRGVGCV